MGTTLQTIIEIAIRYGRATAYKSYCSCDNCRIQALIVEAELAGLVRAFAWENPTKPY